MTRMATDDHYQKHILALHGMKFLGIVVMIVIHTIFWVLARNDSFLPPQGIACAGLISRFLFLGYFSLSLPLLAGAMHRIRAHENQGSQGNSLVHLAGISFALIVLGYLLNVLTWGAGNLFDWDVLGFIGISYLLIALLSGVSKYVLYGAALIILMCSRAIYQNASLLPSGMKGSYILNIFVSLNTDRFFWPVIPWFATMVFGYFIYDCLLSPRIQGSKRTEIFYGVLFPTLLLSAVATYAGPRQFDPQHIWGAWLFHPDLSTLLTLMGVFTGCSFLCYSASSGLARLQWLIKPYSVGILWIFIIHHIVGYRLIQLLKPLMKPYVLCVIMVIFLLIVSWLIGRCVEYCNTHRFELVFRKVEKEGHHE
jgi:hypothetical protein